MYYYRKDLGWVPAEPNPTEINDPRYLMEGSSPENYWYLKDGSGWLPSTATVLVPEGNYRFEVWLPMYHNAPNKWADNCPGLVYNRDTVIQEINYFSRYIIRDRRLGWRARLVTV